MMNRSPLMTDCFFRCCAASVFHSVICCVVLRCCVCVAHYLVPHIGFVVRTRVMCQTGRRAHAADAHGDIVAWLCERAPLWVVVHVCALLREY
jgi:hypothetical protein